MSRLVAEATPDSAGWDLLRVRVLDLDPGESLTVASSTHESALVVVGGHVEVEVDGLRATIGRTEPFSAVADVVYAPPGAPVQVSSPGGAQLAVGQAPADGRLPARVVSPREMSGVLRGGGPARRQVVSCLADPIPAERLIVYEAWVPRGSWTGWPPHRHDGVDGSPVLEETYYFRFDRPSGFGVHRNFAPEEGWEESVLLADETLVPVPRGYHLCGNGPAANMWLLNFLAGSPEDRPRPPYFDPQETWIEADWSKGLMELPAVHLPSASLPPEPEGLTR